MVQDLINQGREKINQFRLLHNNLHNDLIKKEINHVVSFGENVIALAEQHPAYAEDILLSLNKSLAIGIVELKNELAL